MTEFSPRRWGCFPGADGLRRHALVFPTQVGMFLAAKTIARGTARFSPRRWGCFCGHLGRLCCGLVFPTQVGMFLCSCFALCKISLFSPRRWGCFRGHDVQPQAHQVFPTQVGMFLRPLPKSASWAGFPHAGGDVSGAYWGIGAVDEFSPRRWGCFRVALDRQLTRTVFPTQVGMFP